MPPCRKCGKEINHLSLRIQVSNYHEAFFNEKNFRIEKHPSSSTYTGTTYRCPNCYNYLFSSTKQAEKFLKKGKKKNIKTEW